MSNLKKQLTLLAGSVLLLTGCAKDDLASRSDGEMTQVTFTTQLEGQVTTRAAADNDGAAASVNRCIMEVYYGDELFTRQYAAVTNKKASFTITAVANRTYTVAFWADHVENATKAISTDLYYKTDSVNGETKVGLKAVTLKGNYVGNDDKRDAFCYCGSYTINQGGSAFEATLKRPFAQVNVITTDAKTVAKVSSLKPDSVSLTINDAVSSFNVITSTAVSGETKDLSYKAKVYNWKSDTCTLSMDYIFAETTKSVIDIDWKAIKTGNTDVSHSFANIPYQRNYRTNIKGALLTTQGQWNVTVDPVWSTPDEEVVFKVVNNIAAANEVVASNKDKKEINVTFSSEPDDAGNPATSGNNAIVTSLLSENAVYNIDVASVNEVLYVGDYAYDTTGTSTTYDYSTIIAATSDSTKAASVNLVVTDSKYIGTLVVNSPSKSVFINGQTLESGKSYHIENLTVTEVSMSTVIIESGMSVGTLTMVKGGLEIHGTVNSVVIPDGHGDIKVRDCEGLSKAVYDVLAPYIDAPIYAGTKKTSDPETWDIAPTVCKIGDVAYATLEDALTAATNGQTVEVLENIDFTKKYAKEAGYVINVADNVTLNLSGKTVTSNNFSVIFQGNGLTIKNGTFVAADNGSYALFVGDEEATTGVIIEDVTCSAGGMNIYNTTAVIKGSSAGSATNYYAVWADENNTVVNIQSGKFKHNGSNPVVAADENGSIQITGGVYSVAPEDSYIAPGYRVVENTDAATKTDYPWTVAQIIVAKIGDKSYTSVGDAINDVPDNVETTIKMIENENTIVNTYKDITAKKNIILDLNGCTLQQKCSGLDANNGITQTHLFRVYGTLTVKDSKGGGKLYSASDNADWIAGHYTIENTAGSLTIEGGTIENGTVSGLSWAISTGSYGSTATTYIKDGKVVNSNYQAMRNYNNNGGSQSTIIDGGYFESKSSGVFFYQSATSYSTPQMSLTINGGEFHSGTNYIVVMSGQPGTIGVDGTQCILEVNDGVFEAAQGTEQFTSCKNSVVKSNAGYLKGGKFSFKPSDDEPVSGKFVIPSGNVTYPYTIGDAAAKYIEVKQALMKVSSLSDVTNNESSSYIDLWSFWGAKGYTNKTSGAECPQYVLVTDETTYSDANGADEVSAKYAYDTYFVTSKYSASSYIYQYGQKSTNYYFATLEEAIAAAGTYDVYAYQDGVWVKYDAE